MGLAWEFAVLLQRLLLANILTALLIQANGAKPRPEIIS